MEPKPVVLGQQIAAAQAAERARLAADGPMPSPLGNRHYDPERGEFNLTTIVASLLDSEIYTVVSAWRGSGIEERKAVRRALSLDDNYTLIQFSKRMAVRALNERSSDACAQGLTALAMIDESRIDPRDASWAAGLLNHAAKKQPDHSKTMCDEAMALATPGMAQLLSASGRSTLDEWGYREWPTATGIGLIRSGWSHYEPTVDLAAVAQRIGSRVLSENYVVEIEVATDLPAVWFDQNRRDHAAELLKRCRGIVTLHGSLRRSAGTTEGQMFVMWVAEATSPSDGVQLVADVGERSTGDSRSVGAVSAGKLFALLVAGSSRQGVEPFESAATVNDLCRGIRVVLEESAR